MINKLNIPYFKATIPEKTINSIKDVLDSGWLTSGPKVKEFEDSFNKFIGNNVKSLSVNSATSGLHLALESIGISNADEVIIPSLTFTATAEVVTYLDAIPVLVDIDSKTLCASFEQIKKSVSDKTKAVIFVGLAGYPIDLKEIYQFCKERGIYLIEDAAHAFSSRIGGKSIGANTSHITVFSFYANKTITTGEGGMIVTSDIKLYERMKLMRTHGFNKDTFSRFTKKYQSWNYDIIEAGFKYNMSDISAAIGIEQLKYAKEFQKKRSQISCIYNNLLNKEEITLPPIVEEKDFTHAWHLYIIQFKKGNKVRSKILEIFERLNIGFSIHYTPLHKLSYWSKNANTRNSPFTFTDAYFESCLSLPIFPSMSINDAQKVSEVINNNLEL